MDRTVDFVKMYCNWVERCLVDDNKLEELAFFKLGLDLCIRQKELITIKWDQINFPYVEDIKILKETFAGRCYPPREISINTMKILYELSTEREFIFTKDISKMIDSIHESIGDSSFSGHMMRKFGIILRSFNLGGK